MRHGEAVFVDSGAWIALALTRDPHHVRAVEQWRLLGEAGGRLHTSIPVVMETFTFLYRNATPEVALAWSDHIRRPGGVVLVPCGVDDLEASWAWFQRRDLYKLSSVDAVSFAIMRRLDIGLAFTFDHHFAVAGFRVMG